MQTIMAEIDKTYYKRACKLIMIIIRKKNYIHHHISVIYIIIFRYITKNHKSKYTKNGETHENQNQNHKKTIKFNYETILEKLNYLSKSKI